MKKKETKKLQYEPNLSSYKYLFLQADDSFADILEINLNDWSTKRYAVEESGISKFYIQKSWPEIAKIFVDCSIPEDREELSKSFSQEFLQSLDPLNRHSVTFRFNSEELTEKKIKWFSVKIKTTWTDTNKIATIFIKDITLEEENRQKMREYTEKDSVTLLPNKLKFEEKVNSVYKNLNSCGIIIFEIGNLDFFMDIYGKKVGEIVLNKFADAIHSAISKDIDIYKYSEKEILVIGCNVKDYDSRLVFDLIAERIEHIKETENLNLIIFSGKTFATKPFNIDELIQNARDEVKKDKLKNRIDSENKNYLQNVFFQNRLEKFRRYLTEIYLVLDEIDLFEDTFLNLLCVEDSFKLAYNMKGQFSKSIKDFAENNLSEKYVKPYVNFCSIENISESLKKEKFIEFIYEMKDQTLENPWRKVIFKVAEWKDKRPYKIIMAHSLVDKKFTQELQNQKIIQDAYLYAEKANATKTEFLARISHDIRTPLISILGSTNIAQINIDDKEKVIDCLNKISQASNQLLSLVNDLLDYNKIESDSEKVNSELLDLNELIQSNIDILQPLAIEKEQSLSVNSTLKFPLIYSDKSKLNEIVTNLVGNAIKYTQEKGKIQVTLQQFDTDRPNRKFIEIIVKDNGRGMSKEFQKDLFKPFAREKKDYVESTTGSGLGMTIIQNLVRLLNGTITYKSQLRKGTTFIISFPAYAQIENLPNKKAEETEDFSSKFIGKQLLLVEDNQINAEIAKELISLAGPSVKIAKDGETALHIINTSPEYTFDLILMDIQMPGLDGYETTKLIRKIGSDYAKNIPIVALTANTFATIDAKARHCGMNDIIVKPMELDKLTKLFHKFFNKRM